MRWIQAARLIRTLSRILGDIAWSLGIRFFGLGIAYELWKTVSAIVHDVLEKAKA